MDIESQSVTFITEQITYTKTTLKQRKRGTFCIHNVPVDSVESRNDMTTTHKTQV